MNHAPCSAKPRIRASVEMLQSFLNSSGSKAAKGSRFLLRTLGWPGRTHAVRNWVGRFRYGTVFVLMETRLVVNRVWECHTVLSGKDFYVGETEGLRRKATDLLIHTNAGAGLPDPGNVSAAGLSHSLCREAFTLLVQSSEKHPNTIILLQRSVSGCLERLPTKSCLNER